MYKVLVGEMTKSGTGDLHVEFESDDYEMAVEAFNIVLKDAKPKKGYFIEVWLTFNDEILIVKVVK